MSFLRNSDVKKHLARTVPPLVSHPVENPLVPDKDQSSLPAVKIEPGIELPAPTDVPAKADVL